MQQFLKTYGVYDLLEWDCEITSGKMRTKVHFADGAKSQNGITPATYKTKNPIIQDMIEKSPYFKSGRIKLVNAVAIGQVAFADTSINVVNAPSVQAAQVEKEDSTNAGEPKEADGPTKVEVPDLPTAKEYLAKNFGIEAKLMRSQEAIISIAKQHNIVFVGLD